MFVRDSPMIPLPHCLATGSTLATTRGRKAGTDQRAFCTLLTPLLTAGLLTKKSAAKFDSHHCKNIGAAFCPVSLNRVDHHQPPKLAFPPETVPSQQCDRNREVRKKSLSLFISFRVACALVGFELKATKCAIYTTCMHRTTTRLLSPGLSVLIATSFNFSTICN